MKGIKGVSGRGREERRRAGVAEVQEVGIGFKAEPGFWRRLIIK